METPERAARRRQALEELHGKRPQKYRARGTVYGGIRYDSKAEATRAQELDLLIRAGQIRCWTRQPAVYLGCAENLYRPDFLVIPKEGLPWFEDTKGMETRKFARDKRLWRRYGQLELRIIRGGRLVEVVPPAWGVP